jgi:pyruvate/2-oxoglutarate dehydrogenase complex dihydrolipoamide acyltransferase (E2) component
MALLQEIKVPLLAVNDTTLTVVEIAFLNGQKVKKGDLLMVFETSKTTYDVAAEADGYIQYFCEVGNDYEVNQLVAKIFVDVSELEQAKLATDGVFIVAHTNNHQPIVAALSDWEGETIFSEEAHRLIESSGTNISLFKGKDFVSKSDIEEVLGLKPKQAAKTAVSTPAISKVKPASPVDHTKVIVEKLSSGKKREIEYLSDIQSTGLTSTINTIVETGGIFVYVNESLAYLKNSLLPLIVYETARLLKKYTLLNAYYTPDGIALYKEVHVGFAIDIDKGLKVLRLPFTNEKNLAEIEESIMNLSEKYLDDRLEIADLTGIGFTITDLSAEAVDFFKPLVNTMNSAILGISSIDEKLDRCTLSVTFDHRVTEGKTVARFLKELKDRLESYRAAAIYKTKLVSCFKCFTTLEEDLNDVGFAACIKPDGQEGYICQRCFKGF